MKLVNSLGLPDAIVRAVQNDPYDSGDCDISVTRLIQPARKVELERRYGDQITEDVADRLHALQGQLVHALIERAGGDELQEQRLFAECDGWTISGAIDLLKIQGNCFAILDIKYTSSWVAVNGLKPEWEQQLNVYAWLVRQNGFDVSELKIIALFRDWSKLQATRNPDYPQKPALTLDVPLWPAEEAERFVRERVAAHKAARKSLPDCTPEERWSKPDTWAVMKEGRKSALRVLESLEAAKAWALENGVAYLADIDCPACTNTLQPPGYVDWGPMLPNGRNDLVKCSECRGTGKVKKLEFRSGHFVEHRPGEETRCNHYCAVRDICRQIASKEAAE